MSTKRRGKLDDRRGLRFRSGVWCQIASEKLLDDSVDMFSAQRALVIFLPTHLLCTPQAVTFMSPRSALHVQ